MTAPRNRRIAAWLATAAFALTTFSGCTAGDWRYDAPPAAGVQEDVDDAKIRNVMVVSDDQGQAVLLGSVASTQPVELGGIQVAAEAEDGGYGMPVNIEVNASLHRDGIHKLEGSDTQFENPELLLGRLAQVTFLFADGRSAVVQAPIYSSDHVDYAEVWGEVYG